MAEKISALRKAIEKPGGKAPQPAAQVAGERSALCLSWAASLTPRSQPSQKGQNE
jgi:hypothetical protein